MKTTLALALCLSLVAPAYAGDDPDTEIAKRHFAAGSTLYDEGRYEQAIAEFEAARAVKPAPAFDFNIARAYDRLERLDDAIAWYERYVASNPPVGNDGGARERLVVLKRRAQGRASMPVTQAAPVVHAVRAEPAPPRYRYSVVAPAVVGGVALALWGVGAGLVGGTLPGYHHLQDTCAPSCQPSQWATNEHEYQAGVGLLVAAGVVTVADIALWGARRRR